MAKRDPDRTARNRIIQNIKEELRKLLPEVLKATGTRNEQSLNAKIGSKNDDFFDLETDVIRSQEEFTNKWLKGLKGKLEGWCPSPAHRWIYENAKKHDCFKKYLIRFIQRSYFNHFEELSKIRPSPSESQLWIGQTNAEYGLLVTPRFTKGEWENDKSEIRAFKQGYWTIGHVLETGLVIPHKKSVTRFSDVDQYLTFFRDTIVRNSGSKYEYEIAEHYVDFVQNSTGPLDVPLMIPEFRYRGLDKKHQYRLDFMIINPYTLDRVGFELSPWSTHGYLRKIGKLSQKKINEIAKGNFEMEMKKHRDYFRKHGVFVLIFTDDQLKDCDKLFTDEIVQHLQPERPETSLSFGVMEEFL